MSSQAADAAQGGSNEDQPVSKRQRQDQGPRRIRGKKGALKKILDLPVDLVYEICTHLDVDDLLTLSNTNKAFRSVVTKGESQHSLTLFKQARVRMGMPELLMPMHGLRYATWMFGKGCNFCGKSKGGKPDPWLRARVCGACYKSEFLEDSTVEFIKATENLNRYTLACIDHIVAKDGVFRYPRRQLQRISDQLDAKYPMTSHVREHGFVPLEEEEEPVEEDADGKDADGKVNMPREVREAINSDWEFANATLSSTPSTIAHPSNPFQVWFTTQYLERKIRDIDASNVKAWLKSAKQEKFSSNSEIRSSRRQEIERRLEAVGFQKSEFEIEEFSKHLQVRSTRKLSDRTYSTKVEPVLRKILENSRRRRLRTALTNQYQSTMENRPEKSHAPPAAIYLRLAALSSLVNDVSRNPPKSLIVPAAIKSAALDQTLKLIRKRRETLLRGIVKAYLELAQDIEDKKTKEQVEEEEEVTEYSPTTFTSVDKLPLSLPRLPPWVPRDLKKPILATDEQLATFLETSPLSQFECTDCKKTFGSASQIFSHLSAWNSCQFSVMDHRDYGSYATSERQVVGKKDWMAVEGIVDVARPLVRINKESMALWLKFQQAIESTPQVASNTQEFPSLGEGYSMGDEKPEWYSTYLECDCPINPRTSARTQLSVKGLVQHLLDEQRKGKNVQEHKVKTGVRYGYAYRDQYRRLKRQKRKDDGEESPIEFMFDSDSEAEWVEAAWI